MRKRPEPTKQVFHLDGRGIDSCSEAIEEKMLECGTDRQNRVRIRLSFEESLLRMKSRFGEDQVFFLLIRERFGKVTLQLELEGDIYNPLSKTEGGPEDWSGRLLTAVGLFPLYSYSGGRNILRIVISRKQMHPAIQMALALAAGILAGVLLRMIVPDAVMADFSVRYLKPVYNLWIRILTLLSGPVIFLMVCSSALNSGKIAEEGGSSGRVVRRYFLLSMLAALIAVTASGIFLRIPSVKITMPQLNDVFEQILKVIPGDVITPLMQSNTPQILFIAIVLGNALVTLGPPTDNLKNLIHQANSVGLLLTEAVSRQVPFFTAVLVFMEVAEGSLQTFYGIWLTMIIGVLASVIFIVCAAAFVAYKKKAGLGILLRKLWTPFETVMRTGRMDAGFGQMERICVERIGLEKHFSTVSLPYGLVLYMPVNVIGTLLFTTYAAIRYGTSISAGWFLTAMVLSVVLFVATPPVPGANLLAYIMIFNYLRIPSAALIDAMVFDILFGIFAAAANQILLQLELIMQADKIGLLSKEVLRKP